MIGLLLAVLLQAAPVTHEDVMADLDVVLGGYTECLKTVGSGSRNTLIGKHAGLSLTTESMVTILGPHGRSICVSHDRHCGRSDRWRTGCVITVCLQDEPRVQCGIANDGLRQALAFLGMERGEVCR